MVDSYVVMEDLFPGMSQGCKHNLQNLEIMRMKILEMLNDNKT